MKNLSLPSSYATSDFYLASYLKAINLKLLSTEREGRRITFVFESNSKMKDIILSFYNDGMVEVNAYKNAIADLKALIYTL